VTRLTSCPDADSVAERAAAHLVRVIATAIEQRGVAHLALSGGTTPGRTFEQLAREQIDWEKVELWFADERCVPPDDAESNYRLADEKLLQPAAVAPDRVHRMHGELGPREGASRYASELAAALGPAPPVLDVAVLGIGPDGHVASLFPGAPSLAAPDGVACLGIEDSPKPPPKRITLTLPVLRAARDCLLLATGAGKSDAISAMLGEPSRHVPASLLRRERLNVIVDDAAAPEGPLG
jgi:6-phosphogluconolactonase